MLAWTQQNTMQRAMRIVLEWPQSHAISTTINMLTHKLNHNRSAALERSVKYYWGGLNRFYGRPTSPSASIMAQNIQLFGPRGGFLTHQWIIKQTSPLYLAFIINFFVHKLMPSVFFELSEYLSEQVGT